MLQAFIDVAGCTENEAQHWLEMGGFELETAISLFLSNAGTGTGMGVGGGRSHGGMQPHASSSDEYGRRPAPSAASTAAYLDTHRRRIDAYDEDGVRRPDSVKKQRLVDDVAYPVRACVHPPGRHPRLLLTSIRALPPFSPPPHSPQMRSRGPPQEAAFALANGDFGTDR